MSLSSAANSPCLKIIQSGHTKFDIILILIGETFYPIYFMYFLQTVLASEENLHDFPWFQDILAALLYVIYGWELNWPITLASHPAASHSLSFNITLLLWPLAEACLWGWPHTVAAKFSFHALCCFQTSLPLATLPIWWQYLYNCGGATCCRGKTKR